MAEGATIKADQVEGLPDLILEKVREVIREEIKPVPEDMDKLRRSPAGTMIRLEGKVEALDEKMDQRFKVVDERFKALDMKMEQRFEVVDERFKALDMKMEQRFEVVEQRFKVVEQRFEALESKMDQRFDSLKSEMNQRFEALERRFSLFQWVLVLNFSLLIAMAGKLFLMK